MFPQKLDKILARLIRYSFYALFLLVPLIMTPWNYELFEFNKMVTVYFFTILIVCAWLARMVLQRRILFRRTPLDIPFLLFFVFNFLSFVFSIDRHTSLFGYYSRFNGGLLSIVCYVILYWAFVSNLNYRVTCYVLRVTLLSATLVAIYGILQHFGIDKDLWIQDVQNRVFSTMGQPNWLAAYFVGLTPLTWGFALLNYKLQITNYKLKLKIPNFIYYLLSIIYYLCLLYTKSRSGLMGLGVAYLFFWSLLFLKQRKQTLKPFLIFSFSFLILSFTVGTPWTPSLPQILSKSSASQPTTNDHLSAPLAERPTTNLGGTESGEIRQIVWRGAWQVFKSNPILGTGSETFAYSYYWFRPVEHNLTSEWDFLYNKAHNEYLNLLACTGILGLASYLFVVGMFTGWIVKKFKNQNEKINPPARQPVCPAGGLAGGQNSKFLICHFNLSFEILHFALLSGYWGLLVSNFFGFSVVITNLFFFLFPAIAFTLLNKNQPIAKNIKLSRYSLIQLSSLILIIFSFFILNFKLTNYWLADYHFTKARNENKNSQFSKAEKEFQTAINFNPAEALFQVETADNLAQISQNNPEEAENYAQKASSLAKKAISLGPYNLNHLKIAARVYYRLSDLNEEYLLEVLKILKTAATLAPTDAKIYYNLSLLYGQIGENDLAIETLKNTLRLKENYQDAWYALALFYEETNEKDKAIQALENLLKWYPEDKRAKEKLEELK